MSTTRLFPARPARKGIWFPLCLAVLLLLALPGAVLLGLSLAGRQSAVNAWLQGNFSLTYHIPIPSWAALLLFLFPLLIALLYFLKLRRKPIEVPSTFLWRKSIEDLHVNSLFQWLRDNVLLLVQLLIILLLIYAVLAFQVHGSTTSGRHYILLIDNSSSMAVTDVSPSRLEVAKQEALQEIDAHGDGDSGMVIEFNSRATILQTYTRDKGLLRAAVNGIRQTQRPTRVDEALALAESLANPLRSTDDVASKPANEDPAQARTYVQPDSIAADVHLFSDGRFPDVPNFAAGSLTLNYHRVGSPGPAAVDNVGIVTFNAVRDEANPSRLQVFVRVLNYRANPVEVTVELEWRVGDQADLKLKDQAVSLPRRHYNAPEDKNEPVEDVPGEGAVTFDLEDVDEASQVLLHARLKGWRDQFPLDDEAWLVCDVVRKGRVLIATPGNELLRDFFDLEETAKVAEVTYITPKDLKDEEKYLRPAREGRYDLFLFDRCAPATKEGRPAGNTFFIGELPPPWKRDDKDWLKEVVIRNPTSSHPLMRHLTALDEIAFSEALRFPPRAQEKEHPLPPRTARLLECPGETAVLFAVPRNTYTDLVLTFPLINDKGQWSTTWPLKLSFPVFLRNVLYGLGNVSDSAAEENVQPGQPKVLRPAAAVTRLEVVGPKDVRRKLAAGGGRDFVFQDTDQVGVYRASWEGGGRGFAVNLLDGDESNVQPRDEVKLGDQRIESGQLRRQTHETWKWVALAALAVLLLEWALYHRRVFF
jgi:hypothetical protein